MLQNAKDLAEAQRTKQEGLVKKAAEAVTDAIAAVTHAQQEQVRT